MIKAGALVNSKDNAGEQLLISAMAVFSVYDMISNKISNMGDSVSSGCQSTEKRVETMAHSGVFLTKFEVFG